MNIPEAAADAAMDVLLDSEWPVFETAFDLSKRMIEAAMPAIREALAQEIEAVNATIEEAFWSDRPGMARAARIVRGGTP